ncbi:MAG: diguanylate cyclase [Chromatiaceae bacterium]
MAIQASEGFQARKARLREAFRAQLPTRLAEAQAQLAAIQSGAAGREGLARLELTLHTLKGSSGSFGLLGVSEGAREADDLVKAALASEDPVTPHLLMSLTVLLERLAQADLEPVGAPGERLGFEPMKPEPPSPEPGIPPSAVAADPAATPRGERPILLCDDDGDLAQQLCAQLACFGYQVTAITRLADLPTAFAANPPATVIMDIMFPEGEQAGAETLAALATAQGHRIPSIFISCRDDFQARLQAVKAGGSAYCTKPVKTTEIVEFLDALTNRESPMPFHVLVVDDDPAIAALHALILEEAGMITLVATHPAQVPNLLKGFNADLVLMDMYMPECSGPELAKVLRQMPGHVGLPIIYASSETDRERQIKAMEVGADGFLTKPVDPRRLIAEVTLRAERMRTLHARMVRDGLTGLFNHNAIMQFLDLQVANARREQGAFCYVMIDVDRFKGVNDTHGHPAGDQVLMALSRGLRLRLRECDLIGRYGGEEFAVILSGVNEAQAKVIMDHLRLSFAEVIFYAGEATFTCTFSAGIAGFPGFSTTEAILEAADQALYRAKSSGRNRVEIAAAPASLPPLSGPGPNAAATPNPIEVRHGH